MKMIQGNALEKLVSNENVILIDTRPADVYNGWDGENSPGGHIPGAKSLPSKWAAYIDWIEIVRKKGLLEYETIVLYGDKPPEVNNTAKMFEKAGHTDVRIYDQFIQEHQDTHRFKLEKLRRFHHLVPPWWVKTLIEGKKVEHMIGKDAVICHVHYQNPDDYNRGHIPGAIPLDTNDLESLKTWNRRPPAELLKTLTEHGIRKNSTVVLYGRFSFPDNQSDFPGSNAGQLGAMRAAAIMLYAGVKDVKVLNGGLQAWRDERYHVVTDKVKPTYVHTFGGKIPGKPEIMIDTPEAKQLIESDDGEIVSIRSWREWIGEVSGYNYIETKGHIPGAVFGDCGTDAYHMENYRNLDHTMREYHETEANWKKLGLTPDKRIAFYCGTGWRGSEAFLNAWLMGWPHVSVYDGGWFEWSSDPDNPISTKEND